MNETIISANQRVFNHVEGWVGDRVYQIINFISEEHGTSVKGDIVEIGVHHGMLFFLMSSLSKEGEKCIAVDLFDNQALNVDNSGNGSFAKFQENLNNHFPELTSKVFPINADSMSLTPANCRRALSTDGVRAFSVDGGHNVEHVVNDMSVAQELVVPGGFVFLDDFMGNLWPSVTEGFFTYMKSHNRRLAPFLIFQNKLWLTTYSEHAGVLSRLREYIGRSVGDEIHTGRWKYGKLCGFDVLGFA